MNIVQKLLTDGVYTGKEVAIKLITLTDYTWTKEQREQFQFETVIEILTGDAFSNLKRSRNYWIKCINDRT
jgi:hypothetical protein